MTIKIYVVNSAFLRCLVQNPVLVCPTELIALAMLSNEIFFFALFNFRFGNYFISYDYSRTFLRKKMEHKQYASTDEVKADLLLVCDNCFKYNPPSDPVHSQGKTLQVISKPLGIEFRLFSKFSAVCW